MTDAIAADLVTASFAVLAAVDRDGDPWAWPLMGPPGFLQPLGPGLIRALPPVPFSRELTARLAQAPAVSLLALLPQSRGTVHLSGAGAAAGPRLALAVEDARAGAEPDRLTARERHGVGVRPRATRREPSPDAHGVAARRMVVLTATAGVDRFPRIALAGGGGGRHATQRLEQPRRVCVLSVDLSTGRWQRVLADLSTPAAEPRLVAASHGAQLPLLGDSGLDPRRCPARP
jgi:hypothetical protein